MITEPWKAFTSIIYENDVVIKYKFEKKIINRIILKDNYTNHISIEIDLWKKNCIV